MELTAKIIISGKNTEEIKRIAGGLQDVATLIEQNKVDANNVVLLLAKVKENPNLVKTALNFL